MQEKNIGHICPIGRSRVKHTKLHHYKKNVLGALICEMQFYKFGKYSWPPPCEILAMLLYYLQYIPSHNTQPPPTLTLYL